MKRMLSMVVLMIGSMLYISIEAATGTGDFGLITITPVLGPAPTSLSFAPFATNLLANAKNGRINTTVHVVANPKDYTICNNKIVWYNFVYSKSVPMWAGRFNPKSPFQNERGQVVVELIQAYSASGEDSIALSMLSLISVSNDGNKLGDQLTFESGEYSSLAMGIRSDGSIITSGPSDQKVSKVIILVVMKLFDIGDTPNGLDEVQSLVTGSNNYMVTYFAQFIGNPETKVSSTVSVSGYSDVQPKLIVTKKGVFIPNGEPGRTYIIQAAANPVSGPWLPAGTVIGTNTFACTNSLYEPFVGQMQFYRALAK